MKEILRCRLCGNEELSPVLDLGNQPLSCTFPAPNAPDPPAAPLQLVRCAGDVSSVCGALQLRHSADVAAMYGATYGYRSSASRTMRAHLNDIVTRAQTYAPLSPGDAVLDIGCNDGMLLQCYPETAHRIGIDPSAVRFAAEYPPDVDLVYDFFSYDKVAAYIGPRGCKIITSIAMFYDLDDPLSFMRDIRRSLAVDGVWIVELSHLGGMYRNLTYDQICHEHLLYLGIKQFQWMTARTGLKILDVSLNYVNGGSFALTIARDDSKFSPQAENIRKIVDLEAPLALAATHERFARRVAQHRDVSVQILSMLRDSSRVAMGYGASTKGNIVLNYCGAGPQHLMSIRDGQPHKNGLVTPGSRIPIVSPEIARSSAPDVYFVLIWHFRKEIIEDEREYLERGGKFIFHLPMLHVVDQSNYQRYLASDFGDLSFEL